MAYASTEIHAPKKSFFASVWHGISAFFTSLMEANSRAAEIQRLQSLSDRQLADIGLDRQDIVKRVFADKTGM